MFDFSILTRMLDFAQTADPTAKAAKAAQLASAGVDPSAFEQYMIAPPKLGNEQPFPLGSVPPAGMSLGRDFGTPPPNGMYDLMYRYQTPGDGLVEDPNKNPLKRKIPGMTPGALTPEQLKTIMAMMPQPPQQQPLPQPRSGPPSQVSTGQLGVPQGRKRVSFAEILQGGGR